jgi:hypothetical protein
MRKQVESTKKPGNDYYAKTKTQEEQEKIRRTILGKT